MRSFLLQVLLLLGLLIVLIAWVLLPPTGDLILVALSSLWFGATTDGRQAARLTWIGLRSIGSRPGASSVIVIGIACVTGVIASLMAIGAGFENAMQTGGRDDSVILLRSGATSESVSILLRSDVEALSQFPGIARDVKGEPMISTESVVAASLPTQRDGDEENIQLRGIDPMGWVLRPGLRIIEGRRFHPGARELVVGDALRGQYAILRVGATVHFGSKPWRIVGVFHSGEAYYDSELWADRSVVAGDYRRGDTAQSVLLKLASPSRLEAFSRALEADPGLHVESYTTRAFFAWQTGHYTAVVRGIGLTVGAIMALGAAFGALNCMFASVAARIKEIATLRAIGFGGGSTVAAVMMESIVLALLGGVIGALIAWVCFNGYITSTRNGFNQVIFHLQVNADVLISALKWALAIGVVGGLYPGLRSARVSVTRSLRDA